MTLGMSTMNRIARVTSTTIIIGLAAAALVACSGNSRVRKPAELVPVSNQFDMQPVWSTSVGSSESFNFHPVVAGDAVYAASHRGNLAKIDLATGNKLWEVSVPERLAIGPGSDGRTTVAVSTKGTVFAYDEAGKPIWNVSVGSEVLSEPIVAGGIVIVRALDNRFVVAREGSRGPPPQQVAAADRHRAQLYRCVPQHTGHIHCVPAQPHGA